MYLSCTALKIKIAYSLFLIFKDLFVGLCLELKASLFCRYNLVMLGLSASFLVLSYWLTWLFGGVGFILANCCNMALRIIHSLIYIHHYFKHSDHTPLSGLRPHPVLLIVLTISSILTAISEVKLTKNK